MSGLQRLSNVADSTQQAQLDPGKHLRAGRHGEWTHSSLSAAPRAGPAWGVTLVPPGADQADPALMAAIRAQHAR